MRKEVIIAIIAGIIFGLAIASPYGSQTEKLKNNPQPGEEIEQPTPKTSPNSYNI